jgi:hypothetical protein
LEEIHKGVCGNHASSRTLVSKAFRRAFYWPELVRRCQGCQYFDKQQHVSNYKLVTIPPTWPFACWGLDMIGPLPTAPGGFNRVLVAINKFTKWKSSRSPAQRPTEYSTSWMNSCTATDYPTASSQTWGPTLTTTSSGSIARTTGSTSVCLSRPSTGQRTSRALQWDGTRRSQEATARRC